MVVTKWQGLQAFQRLVVLLLVVLLPSSALQAAARSSLYQAEVSAEQTQQQWQREALQQVLIRVTGQPDIMQQPQLRSELANAASYVKQFEAVRTDHGNSVRVLLDAQRIQQLLRQQQIPIWGGQRPELLFWIVEQQGAERQFVRQSDSVWLQSLQEALTAQALPYTLPLYDIDDLLNLTETDVWAGFWQQIEQASSRYRVHQIVVLLLEAAGNTEAGGWKLTALRQHDGNILRDELEATSEQQLMQQYADRLSQQLAQQYAILLTPNMQQQAVLQINGLKSLADVVTLERRFSELLGVSRVQIVRHAPAETLFGLTLQMSEEQLLQSLVFEPNLTRRPAADPWSSDYATATTPQTVLAEFDYSKP
ncbi:hypothetical protein GCM10010919_21750 [Alishewanella longhuensis]|uniref:DUF2066 domain-containing protein n=1 Tax=Alishewanella longhuensis TaxID=1091037 RepID=A0ABQ3KZ82_9ALTE|nr:DUF2066 domain-containing protein [Alishewanella longhuensis]GHG70898.1 hypothetical protein GCM10010919_21750 [Alishewanella longhuensis]